MCFGVHGLGEEPIKEKATAACSASIEAEGELVEVVREVTGGGPVLQSSLQPSL